MFKYLLIIYLIGMLFSPAVYFVILYTAYEHCQNIEVESNVVATLFFLLLGAFIWPIGIIIAVSF